MPSDPHRRALRACPDRRAVLLAGLAACLPLRLRAGGLRDAWGQPVVSREARRIVSLGPDITEILFALGAGDRIIGRDQSSRWPPEVQDRPNLGHRRRLSAEGVVSVAGDLVLAADDVGPPEAVEVLRATGIPFVAVPHDPSLSGILAKIAVIAALLDREAEGAALSRAVEADYRAAEAISAHLPDAERKRVVFFHGLVNLSAAGSGTAAGEILRAAGARNIFADHNGYLQASPELVLERDPEIVVMMPVANGGPFPSEVFAHRALAATTAARNGALMIIEDNLMIGFGPRTAGQIRRLAAAFYPDLAADSG